MARINRESDRINSKRNQKTNCPVNDHLGSPIYTPKKWYTAPSAGEDEIPLALFVFKVVNIRSICQFPACFSLKITF